MPTYRETYQNGHRWYIDSETGQKVPSVTSVTAIASPFKGRPGNAAKIGSLIHFNILKNYTNKALPLPRDFLWNIADEEVHGRIASALRMWKDLAVELRDVVVEDIVFNTEYGYAGRVDRHGWDCGMRTVDEIKTGAWYDHYWLQGAAYAKAIGAEQVRFIMLDTNAERNPLRVGRVITMGSDGIAHHFEEFLRLLERFNETLK